MPIIGRILRRIFEAKRKPVEEPTTKLITMPICPPKSLAMPLYPTTTAPSSSTIKPLPLSYIELPRTGGWRNGTEEQAQASSTIINNLRILGAKLRCIKDWEELNSLPIHTVLFDGLAYKDVPLRIIKFDYTGDDVKTVRVRVKTVAYNEDWSLNHVDNRTLSTFHVCVIPGEKERYVTAPIISAITKEIDGPSNWKIEITDKIARASSKRLDSSVLLVGKKTTKDATSPSTSQLGSGDFVSDIVKCGGAFEKIKDKEVLSTLPLYTVVRTGNEYCRVVKITISYGGYISLHVRTVEGNRYVCGRLVDSVITDREESYKLFYVAKRGERYIIAPPVSETDTYQIEGSRNYTISVKDPISKDAKRFHNELESRLVDRSGDGIVSHTRGFFGYNHSGVIHKPAVPILMIFDSKGRPVNKKVKHVLSRQP
jgi:hypothetical protein